MIAMTGAEIARTSTVIATSSRAEQPPRYYGNITWGVSFASLNNTNDAASGWPSALNVYEDTVYKTFLFSFYLFLRE
jgi:hypothetical protein